MAVVYKQWSNGDSLIFDMKSWGILVSSYSNNSMVPRQTAVNVKTTNGGAQLTAELTVYQEAMAYPAWDFYGYVGYEFLNMLATDFTKTFSPSPMTSINVPIAGKYKWIGGVLAPNGKIYGIPGGATDVLVVDTNNDSVSHIGSFSSVAGKWGGGVLATNGKIYGIPRYSSTILEIDPISGFINEFGSITGDNKYLGGVLGPNGKIYCVPLAATSVLVIDPFNPYTYPQIGSLGSGNKWAGGALAPNGKIYCAPYDSTSILEIDTYNNTVSTFGTISGSSKYHGATLAPNGKIYCAPYKAGKVLEIDPINRTATQIGSSIGERSCITLGLNGKLYLLPYNAGYMVEIDVISQTHTYLHSIERVSGLILAQNGKFYTFPASGYQVYVMGQTQQIDENAVLSRYLNKF